MEKAKKKNKPERVNIYGFDEYKLKSQELNCVIILCLAGNRYGTTTKTSPLKRKEDFVFKLIKLS